MTRVETLSHNPHESRSTGSKLLIRRYYWMMLSDRLAHSHSISQNDNAAVVQWIEHHIQNPDFIVLNFIYWLDGFRRQNSWYLAWRGEEISPNLQMTVMSFLHFLEKVYPGWSLDCGSNIKATWKSSILFFYKPDNSSQSYQKCTTSFKTLPSQLLWLFLPLFPQRPLYVYPPVCSKVLCETILTNWKEWRPKW